MQVEKSDTASATAAWKVIQTLGYVNERPFQETQNFLKKALEILKILEQSGINPEYWGGVLGIPLMADEGQQCKFWWPSEDMFIPTKAELERMKMQLEQERRVKQSGKV